LAYYCVLYIITLRKLEDLNGNHLLAASSDIDGTFTAALVL